MKWTDETIQQSILALMDKLDIQRMPTNTEMKAHKLSGLSRAISLTGGVYRWSEKMNIPMKEREKKWTDQLIEEEIVKSMKILCVDRMPTASELQSIGRNDLHCAISRSKYKYSGWSKRLKVSMKDSETTKGNSYERIVGKSIKVLFPHMEIQQTSTKHPYDLLVNGCVKLDVKVASPHYHFGTKAHTFALNKKHPTCDIYICVALDEKEEIERVFVIPSKNVQIVTLNIGKESKYNKYQDNWELIERLAAAYEEVIAN